MPLYVGNSEGKLKKIKTLYVGQSDGTLKKIEKLFMGNSAGTLNKIYTADERGFKTGMYDNYKWLCTKSENYNGYNQYSYYNKLLVEPLYTKYFNINSEDISIACNDSGEISINSSKFIGNVSNNNSRNVSAVINKNYTIIRQNIINAIQQVLTTKRYQSVTLENNYTIKIVFKDTSISNITLLQQGNYDRIDSIKVNNNYITNINDVSSKNYSNNSSTFNISIEIPEEKITLLPNDYFIFTFIYKQEPKEIERGDYWNPDYNSNVSYVKYCIYSDGKISINGEELANQPFFSDIIWEEPEDETPDLSGSFNYSIANNRINISCTEFISENSFCLKQIKIHKSDDNTDLIIFN